MNHVLPTGFFHFGLIHATLSDAALHGFVATTVLLEDLGIHCNRQSGPSVAEAYLQDHHRRDVPIALDTGCSLSVSPFLEDFTTELTPTPDGEMRGLNHAAAMSIKGIGYVDWPIRNVFGRVSLVHTKCYQ